MFQHLNCRVLPGEVPLWPCRRRGKSTFWIFPRYFEPGKDLPDRHLHDRMDVMEWCDLLAALGCPGKSGSMIGLTVSMGKFELCRRPLHRKMPSLSGQPSRRPLLLLTSGTLAPLHISDNSGISFNSLVCFLVHLIV
ncbi:hypothetical protein COOONC_07700 [Cooperia oncophora]